MELFSLEVDPIMACVLLSIIHFSIMVQPFILLGAKREPTEWLLRVEPLGFGEWRLVRPLTS